MPQFLKSCNVRHSGYVAYSINCRGGVFKGLSPIVPRKNRIALNGPRNADFVVNNSAS